MNMRTLIIAVVVAACAFLLASYTNSTSDSKKAQETYIIVSAKTTAELERQVTQKLRERYDTEGGVTFANGSYHQAMTSDH